MTPTSTPTPHELAVARGYTLLESLGGRTTYQKQGVSLTLFANGKATLSAVAGDVKVSIEKFDFPNANMGLYEAELGIVLEAARGVLRLRARLRREG